MENASKALIIAGGILLALLIITFLLYTTGYIRTIRQSEREKTTAEQLQKFNQEYEVYNKKLLYGQEVLSLINKMNDNNARNSSNFLKMEYNLQGFTLDSLKEEIEAEKESKTTTIYTCTGIQYSTETGRVKSMTFKKYQ